MDEKQLAETINKSFAELGFARIPKAAVVEIFSRGEPISFEVHERLEKFVASQSLELREEGDFFVFEPKF